MRGVRKKTTRRPVHPSRGRLPRLVLRAALLAALALACGAAWIYLRARPAHIETEPMVPEERALHEAARRHPADADAQRALGLYLLEQHRPFEAIWAFQELLDRQPADTEACRDLARALIVAQLPQRALEALAACPASSGGSGSRSSPGPSDAVENGRVAAAAYLSMGDALVAIAVLRSAGPALNTAAPALLDLGNAEEALGDDLAAAATYQRLLQLKPDDLEAELALARVAARERRWDVALPALLRARRIAPADPRPLYQLSLVRLAQGGAKAAREKPAGPIDLLQGVLRAHPNYGPAHVQMGLWLVRRGQPGAAALSLERAVALHAGGEGTRRQLAAALEAARHNVEAAYQRGLYFEATQQPHRALREYQRMAVLDPSRKDVPLLLSTVYSHLEMREQAAAVVRRGLERHPEDPQLLARRAMLLIMLNDRPAAIALCRRWLQRQPDAAEPYYLLAQVERDRLNAAEAARLSELAMALDPRNAGYCLEAALDLIAAPTRAHLLRASALLRRAISLDPHQAETHLRLGDVLERLGDLDDAREEYARSLDDDHSGWHAAYALSQLCPRLGKGGRGGFYAQIARVLREREDAFRPLWRQVSRDPNDVDVHVRLANLLLQSDDLRQARYQLEQALERQPGRKKEAQQLAVLRRLLAMREE